MKEAVVLDSALFQLTPTRTRCELVISSGGVTEKLASGLLKPFLSHLKTAEEQIEKGGYSIVLEVASGDERSWFTKGTLERFVRFVSTPEILERITTVEIEIVQIEESISAQCNEASLAAAEKLPKYSANGSLEGKKMMVDLNPDRTIVPFKPRRESINDTPPVQGENSKVQLLKILENRKIALQKEQGMAYARAAAAGFDNEHMTGLVSFAEYFGALRLRKSCLNIMDMYKRKQEAGLWLEEMEMAAMEDNSSLSEMSFAGASGIMLNSNSVCQSMLPAACDDPSNLNELNQTAGMRGAHGNYTNLSINRDNGIPTSTTMQIPMGIAGANENIQQSTVPVWPGQPPKYVQNFQSHMVGPGPPLQGFHGLPMQGIQLGSPYYQSYPGNSYWPQFIENPIFGPPQRTESSGMSNVSAGSKHYATNGTEEGSPVSPKSVSLSQSFTDQGGHSELEKECMIQPQKSSHRRSSHRSSNKHSGMVVIRNINYITSKGHDGVSEESESESDSNSEIIIDLSDKKQKNAGGLPRKRGSRNHIVDGCNSNEKDGKYEVSTDNPGGEDDNSSWQVFQTCLLKENESSENEPKNDKGNATHTKGQISVEPEMDAKVKEHMNTENSDLQMISELEANNGEPMSEIRSTMSKEQLLLPQRANSTWVEKHAVMGAEREKLSIHKKPIIDDSIVISEQHSEMKLAHTVSQWDTSDNIEHTISRNDDHLHTGIRHGQCLVDDSFMVSTRSVPQEQANIEWKTQLSMDSELPFIDKGQSSSNDAPQNKSETSISWEPADLFMVPERNSERDSLGQSWNPAIDNDIQELVNIVDHKYPEAELNGDVSEEEILKKKQSNAYLKELPEMKISSKKGQLKETEEALAKRKADTTARGGKKTKLSPLAEAQLRAEKLRAFKAALQKTKNEKDEEDRKRIEELKMQRQKRIAGRTTSAVNKSTSNSCSSRQQLVKPTITGKLSSSMQKDRSSNNLSTAHSLPRPITKISNEAIKRLSSHKSKASGDALSQSVSPRVILRKENSNVSKQLRSVVQAKQIPSNMKNSKQVDPTKVGISGSLKANGAFPVSPKNVEKVFPRKAEQLSSNGLNVPKKENKENGSTSDVKKNSDQGLTLQQGIEGGKLKTKGTVSHSTPHSSVNSDLKKKSAEARKSLQPVSTSTEKSTEICLDLNDGVGKNALPSSEGSNLDNGVANMKSKENTGVKFKNSSKVTEIKNQVKASESDDDSRTKQGNLTNSAHISTQESTFNNVKQAEVNEPRTPECSVDDGFEIIKVSEAVIIPLTEVAMSGSPSYKQLASQQSSFKVSSFVPERCNPEDHDRAPTAPVPSLDNSPSESLKFCTSSAPVTPENSRAREEVFTPRLNVFGSNDPHVISSSYPSANPDLRNVIKSSLSNSPVADDGKSDSLNSRKRWGNSENSAKGLRRFLMFGRKPRSSMAPPSDVVSSLETSQG
ncbi:hypothetical protein KI387_034630 [Taxus chinensis]|uniref:COP1-interacting protein 7 n=1 Tax=Taxus chinensis TaxID=29808 RepID=A0AA38F5K7_TAXCH|nr:hypothetical protein KI387_034630 [Taxus chinensis]